MFSTADTVSLFELQKRIYELMPFPGHNEASLEIACLLGYPSETPWARIWSNVAEDLFTISILSADEFWVISSSGVKLRASSLFCEYLDLPRESELRADYERRSHGSKWLFFEYPTMLLTTKNWDTFGKEMLVGADGIDDAWVPSVAERIRPFEGWSLCVAPSSCPETISDLLALVKEDQKGPRKQETKILGRRPTGTRAEYLRRYPEKKPDILSFDAISAELTGAGFPISSRQIQNYERERKNEIVDSS